MLVPRSRQKQSVSPPPRLGVVPLVALIGGCNVSVANLEPPRADAGVESEATSNDGLRAGKVLQSGGAPFEDVTVCAILFVAANAPALGTKAKELANAAQDAAHAIVKSYLFTGASSTNQDLNALTEVPQGAYVMDHCHLTLAGASTGLPFAPQDFYATGPETYIDGPTMSAKFHGNPNRASCSCDANFTPNNVCGYLYPKENEQGANILPIALNSDFLIRDDQGTSMTSPKAATCEVVARGKILNVDAILLPGNRVDNGTGIIRASGKAIPPGQAPPTASACAPRTCYSGLYCQSDDGTGPVTDPMDCPAASDSYCDASKRCRVLCPPAEDNVVYTDTQCRNPLLDYYGQPVTLSRYSGGDTHSKCFQRRCISW